MMDEREGYQAGSRWSCRLFFRLWVFAGPLPSFPICFLSFATRIFNSPFRPSWFQGQLIVSKCQVFNNFVRGAQPPAIRMLQYNTWQNTPHWSLSAMKISIQWFPGSNDTLYLPCAFVSRRPIQTKRSNRINPRPESERGLKWLSMSLLLGVSITRSVESAFLLASRRVAHTLYKLLSYSTFSCQSWIF